MTETTVEREILVLDTRQHRTTKRLTIIAATDALSVQQRIFFFLAVRQAVRRNRGWSLTTPSRMSDPAVCYAITPTGATDDVRRKALLQSIYDWARKYYRLEMKFVFRTY